MFFVLSKTVSLLFLPLTVICILLLASLFARSSVWKKRLWRSGLILLIFFSNEFISNEVMRAWEVEATPIAGMRRFRIGIVLTGTTIPDMEPADRVYFHRGADRVIHTVQLYKLGLIQKILISGGSGSLTEVDEPEADKYRRVMLLMGVPDAAIIIENVTRNTAESAAEVRRMLVREGYNAKDCLLITSAFHMRRSLASYRKAGVDLEGFSTDFYGHKTYFYPDALIVPQVDAIQKWHKLVKEWMGMIAYKAAGYI